MVGQTISHYRITEKLGEGGMGVVYKAQDTKLDRPVALKFLAAHALEDPEYKARFVREAKAAARLDHQNICPVYEIDEVDGQTFLAMAYLEGQTLKDKIAERPLKLDEALDIAIQTAQGLKVAHQKEIVHRDIKPANLMLTGEGQVKIMDFGLAQLAEQSRLTKTTTMLGTPAYMSPEQAQRLPTDHRTDVWSLGIVIYEMATGRLPFEGERQEAVLYAIANEEPELPTALRSRVPLELDRIVEKALAKSPDERYQHVDEVIVDLRGLRKKLESGKATVLRPQPAAGQARTGTRQPVVPPAPSEQMGLRRKLHLPWALFAVSAIALLAVSFLHFREAPSATPEAPLRKFALTPPVPLGGDWDTFAAISPNGKHIAFPEAGEPGRLWVQDLDSQQLRAIEGTEGATGPFWSPGSDFIGFGEISTGGELRKVSVEGGPVITLCQIPGGDFYGGAWSPDGDLIVFGGGAAQLLYEVPAAGGTPKPLFSPGQIEPSTGRPIQFLKTPHFLPSGAGARVLVFTFGLLSGVTMMLQDLETGRREVLGPGVFPFYSPSSHLVYQSSDVISGLWALPFSLDTLKAAGDAFPIAQNGRNPTVAADGTLVFFHNREQERQLVWYDRRGERIGEVGQPQVGTRTPALSPDERLIAFRTTGGSKWDVWVYDIARGVKTLLSTAPGGDAWYPVWSPTGKEVAFLSNRAGQLDIFLTPAGGGEEEVLLATADHETANDWSRDGNYLLYTVSVPETGDDLWYLERDGEGNAWEPHPFLQTPSNEYYAKFSPDGRYVAYVSEESGQSEIYVRPFPEGSPEVTISGNGGNRPHWRRDGKELFYIEGNTVIAVSVSTEPSFSAGSPAPLFKHPSLGEVVWAYPYDVSADGRRFILTEPVGEAPQPSIRVVQNWYEEFRDREQE